MTYPALDRLVGATFFDMAAARYAGTHPAAKRLPQRVRRRVPEFLPRSRRRASFPISLTSRASNGRSAWPRMRQTHGPRPAHGGCTGSARPRGAAFRASPLGELPQLGLSGRPDRRCGARRRRGGDGASRPVERISAARVHRGPDGVEAARLEPGAYEFVSRLCAGEALGRLLESARAARRCFSLRSSARPPHCMSFLRRIIAWLERCRIRCSPSRCARRGVDLLELGAGEAHNWQRTIELFADEYRVPLLPPRLRPPWRSRSRSPVRCCWCSGSSPALPCLSSSA